ncbi:hypothetical protein FQN57_007176 [Myotisia sp. PD_48]|nr:hypothetical protein FQN57_007176 [Myotisia sp. PD_48]
MPYATHWVCCCCHFGPMLIEKYPTCVNCQHSGARSNCCEHKWLTNKASHYGETQSISSPYHTPYTKPASIPLLSRSPAYDRLNHQYAAPIPRGTHMYICCICRDGPKVFEHHTRCIVCKHDACDTCTYMK